MHGAAAAFDGGWIDRVSGVVHLLLALALLIFLVAVLPAVWSLRKSYTKVSALVDRLTADVTPITARAGQIADDVGHVTTAVRADLARVTALVARSEARIDATLVRAEARARDLEALLAVAQAQAEDSLVAAASTVAGVREGFTALRNELAGVSHRPATDDALDDRSRAAFDDAAHDDAHPARDDGAHDPDVPARPRIRARER